MSVGETFIFFRNFPRLRVRAGAVVTRSLTQKERDVETGLDYFNARYYSSTQGRFTSVDPLMASGRANSPQTWNRYAYVLNNPLKLVDPTGLQADDSQEFSFNPCEMGNPGCNPVQLAIVTIIIPPEEPISLETTDLSILESVTLNATQVVQDTAIGAGKSAYNTLFGTANLINAPIDFGLSFFTDFQFGQAELYSASTPGEQGAMDGMLIGSFWVAGGGGAIVAPRAGVSASGSTALVPMEDALITTGNVRTIAGYEGGGNAGLVGTNYNVNIWGLYSTPNSQGLGAFTQALRAEASAAGATGLNITGVAIRNPNS